MEFIFLILFLFLVLIPYLIYRLFKFFKLKILAYLSVILYFIFIFLVIIMLPGFIPEGSKDRAKLASVKVNMNIFQTMLETYSVDSNGNYPKNVEELEKIANKGEYKYWKDLKNPFTLSIGKGKSFDNFEKKVFLGENNNNWYFKEEIKEKEKVLKYYKSITNNKGLIYYNPIINDNGKVTKYFIYGCDQNGELFKNNNTNEFFTLYNE